LDIVWMDVGCRLGEEHVPGQCPVNRREL
jgi:hypothetical protein